MGGLPGGRSEGPLYGPLFCRPKFRRVGGRIFRMAGIGLLPRCYTYQMSMGDKIAWQVRFWAPALFLACVLGEFVAWRAPAHGVGPDMALTGAWVAFGAFLALVAVTERGRYLSPGAGR